MTMNNAFKKLFDPIQADEELKEQTKAFLLKKVYGYTGGSAQKHIYRLYAMACICFLFILGGGRWLYFTPVAQISIDINPSIEINVNRFGQVLSVNHFNDDGKELSNTTDLKYKNYTDAIEQILKNDTIEAMLSDSEIMTITVVSSDESQSTKILSGIEPYTAKQNNIRCHSASSKDVAPAHEMGLSHGKYRAFLELQRLDPNITPEMVQEMTMKEIRELIESLSPDSENGASSHNDRETEHHGHGGSH